MIRLGPIPPGPIHVLAIGAHADDIEIGAAGLLLSWLAAGLVRDIDWVVLSAVGERADEAIRSAEALVAGRATTRVEIATFRERFFPHVPEVKEFIDDLRSHVHPDVVIGPRLEDRHQDHRTVAELLWQAFRDQLILEYEIVKYEGDLGSPNAFVPLAREVVDQKIVHLEAAFPSQAHRPWYDATAFRALMRLRGIEANAPSGYAEAFTARKMSLAV